MKNRDWCKFPLGSEHKMEINRNFSLMSFYWVQALSSVIRYIRCTSTVITIGEQVPLQFICVISNNERTIDRLTIDWFQLHHVNSHKSLSVGQSKEELFRSLVSCFSEKQNMTEQLNCKSTKKRQFGTHVSNSGNSWRTEGKRIRRNYRLYLLIMNWDKQCGLLFYYLGSH